MNLVSENIRFMRIFAGVPLGAGVKPHWGLSTTSIFGYVGGYVFEDFRDTASNNMWRYATDCRPANDCKVNDLEWLFHDKMRFWPAVLESERLNVRNSTTSAILRCSKHFTICMYLYLYSYCVMCRSLKAKESLSGVGLCTVYTEALAYAHISLHLHLLNAS